MNSEEFLNEVCKQIKYKPAQKEIVNELRSHINELKEEYIQDGTEEKEAEKKAILEMGIARDIGKKLNKIHKPKLDWKLLVLSILLVLIGVMVTLLKDNTTQRAYYYIQNNIKYILYGSIVGAVVYLYNYKKLEKHSNLIYIIAMIITILPFIGLGIELDGKTFVYIGMGISFLPYVVAVPLYIIAFSGFINSYNKNKTVKIFSKEIKVDLLKIILLSLISILLIILLQALEYAIILGIIYLVIASRVIIKENKSNWKKLINLYTPIAILTLFLAIGIYAIKPNKAVIQEESFGSYKLIGETENKNFKSEEAIISNESNYTISYLIGKAGILVGAMLVFIITLTSLAIIINMKKINEQYGNNLTIGLGMLFILETIGNIIVNTNIGIGLDINLPFVTYGSANFIINTFCISMILSIYRRKDIISDYNIGNNENYYKNK